MRNALEVPHRMGAYLRPGGADAVIAALAATQHGVVAYRQLIAAGVTRRQIEVRVAAGRLHRLHRGVFAVGHVATTREGRWLAAVLAAGPGGALSHRPAAEHLALLEPRSSVAHVTVAARRAQRAGMRLHVAVLPPDEVETHDGILTTTVARTLLDMAATARPQTVARAFHEAEYLRRSSPTSLGTLLERHPRRPGAAVLRELLARGGRLRTRTEMEEDFLAFCDAFGLPRPDDTNTSREVHGGLVEADAVYAAARVIVELDGGSHRTERRFHGDRARDRANLADGWRTVRVTSRHLDHEREALAADLARLLAPIALEVPHRMGAYLRPGTTKGRAERGPSSQRVGLSPR